MFGPLMSASETEAQVGFLFHVMIGTNPFGVFRSVSGIGRRVDAEELREGGRNHSPHLRVGPSKYQECKIEWGLTNSTALYDWIHAVEAGYAYKRAVTVVQFNRMFVPLRIYLLWDAWPLSWEAARLNANDNGVDTEEIILAYEAVTLIPIPTEVSWTLPFEPPLPLIFPNLVNEEDPTRAAFVPAGLEEEEDSADLPSHFSKSRKAEKYVPPVIEEEETSEEVHVSPSRLAEEPTETVWDPPSTDGPRDPVASRVAEEAEASEASTLATPDYGDLRMERAEFPAISFSSGTFYSHEAQEVKLSSGLFFEPTVWEDYT
jgi:phage tail-like protein